MIIRAETIQAVLPATTNTGRAYAATVYVEPAGNRLVATNGHILLVATDTNPMSDTDYPYINGVPFPGNPPANFVVPQDTLTRLVKSIPKKSITPIFRTVQAAVAHTPDRVTLTVTDCVTQQTGTVQTGDASDFPDYQRLLDKEVGPTVALCLGVPILEVLLKAAKAINDKPSASIVLRVPTGQATVDSAIPLTITGEHVTITGLLMPMRLP